jgi:hypothetical protein
MIGKDGDLGSLIQQSHESLSSFLRSLHIAWVQRAFSPSGFRDITARTIGMYKSMPFYTFEHYGGKLNLCPSSSLFQEGSMSWSVMFGWVT